MGSGGHALKILSSNQSILKLVGIDWDPDAIQIAAERLKDFSEKVILVQENFVQIRKILDELKIEKADGILLDLGISSLQLENPERGFSFLLEGPLDMRMDKSSKIMARDLVNNYPLSELEKIIKLYGEERWAKRIARMIGEFRKREKIETTTELVSIINQAIPRRFRPQKIHPATKIFQALRIAVNNELSNLQEVLDESIKCLKRGGRLCVISFHSLEDRIVKDTFKNWEKKEGKARIITPKPITPSFEEISINPRSRSAKLRVAERL